MASLTLTSNHNQCWATSLRLFTVPVAELQERKDQNVPVQHSTLTLGFKKVQQYQGVPDYVQYIDTGLQESTTRPMWTDFVQNQTFSFTKVKWDQRVTDCVQNLDTELQDSTTRPTCNRLFTLPWHWQQGQCVQYLDTERSPCSRHCTAWTRHPQGQWAAWRPSSWGRPGHRRF